MNDDTEPYSLPLVHVVTRDVDSPVQVSRFRYKVAVVLDPGHAEVLAMVLARFDALVEADGIDFTFDRDTWIHHTLIDLLKAAALVGVELPAPVYAKRVAL